MIKSASILTLVGVVISLMALGLAIACMVRSKSGYMPSYYTGLLPGYEPGCINILPKHPHTQSPHTLHPHTLQPHTKSPHTLHPHTLQPHTKSPHTLHPHTLHPHTKSPHTLHPHTKSPHTLHPHTQSPHTLHPHTLHPHTQSPPPPHSGFSGYSNELEAQKVVAGKVCVPQDCKAGAGSCFCVYGCDDSAMYGDCSNNPSWIPPECPPNMGNPKHWDCAD